MESHATDINMQTPILTSAAHNDPVLCCKSAESGPGSVKGQGHREDGGVTGRMEESCGDPGSPVIIAPQATLTNSQDFEDVPTHF